MVLDFFFFRLVLWGPAVEFNPLTHKPNQLGLIFFQNGHYQKKQVFWQEKTLHGHPLDPFYAEHWHLWWARIPCLRRLIKNITAPGSISLLSLR